MMDWTPEALDALRDLWGKGHSSAEIGRRLGCSKNAVVGKAHRLDLPARPTPIRPKAEAPKALVPRPAPPMPVMRQPAPAPRLVPPSPPPRPPALVRPLQAVAGRGCQWPHGDPKSPDFRFCCDPTLIGRSYCDRHCAIAYTWPGQDVA